MLKHFTVSHDAHLAWKPSKEIKVEIYKIIAMLSKMLLYLWKEKIKNYVYFISKFSDLTSGNIDLIL